MKTNEILKILTIGCLTLTGLSSCLEMKVEKLNDAKLAVYNVGSDSIKGGGVTGRAVFEAQVLPLIATARCVSCHISQSPQIGQADQGAAYAAAKTALNLGIPSQSRLILKAGDGHCAPTCSILGSGVWSPAVLAWAEAENRVDTGTVPSGAPIFLSAKTILDTTRVNAVINYPLSGRGADFTNVSFQVTLTDPALNSPNLAVISSLKIVNGSNKSILVEGIQIFQSVDATVSATDPEDFNSLTGNDFSNISVIVPPNTTTALSVASSVIDKEESGGFIAFGFQKLQVSP